ncbi:hypothetical protein [Streptomyces sp. MZ04]|uniref:hypothetical protein n=1 Tax=Streptomyces sp. MZ04 TaxID=2559236 RepID=UPI00107E72FE|nr:hypothetical protein [Streptomyces sp. MZ04]TGA99689.1 hypothetical protein E2651_29410 [Streptomyces sp. MZ04]
MVPEMWTLLLDRMSEDRKSSGNRELARGHYMNIVLLEAPLDIDHFRAAYAELSKRFRGQLPKGGKTTIRVSPEAAEQHRAIKDLCDAEGFSRKGVYIHSALLLGLLRSLKDLGALPKEELPPLL